MKKLFVKSLCFAQGEQLGERGIKAELTNGTTIIIDLDCGMVRYSCDKPTAKMTKTEIEIADLIKNACFTFLDDGEPETMSLNECIYAERLALERFDWGAAGYDPNGTREEKCAEMITNIAHFENI